MKKALIGLLEKLERLPGEDARPNFCCFGITDECMLRCRMCHKWKADIAVEPGAGEPDLSRWKEAIVSLREITGEGFLINFGGGEPFLKDGILEIVRFAADKGFKTNIATNAFLIDEDKAKAIAASGLSTINISLDSFHEETHDRLRGVAGVYRRAWKAVEYLDKHCPGLEKGICTVIYGVNLEEILELTAAVQKDSRLDWIYFMAAMQPNNTAPDPGWYRGDFQELWPQDAKKARRVLDKLLEFKRRGYKIANQIPQLKAFKAYFSDPEKFIKAGHCNLSRALHVSATGDVFICFRWEKLGNIKDGRLADFWRSDTAALARKNILECKQNCHFLVNCFFEGDFPYFF